MATTKVDVNLIGATGTPGSGNFLRGDGSWNAPAGGFTLGTEQATTSGTSVTFGSIPAGTKMIIIMLEGVSFSGAGDLDLTIGDAGGLETSGYTGGSALISGGGVVYETTKWPINGSNAADVFTGQIILALHNSGNFTWSQSHSTWVRTDSYCSAGGGSKDLSAELTQLSLSGGTFDAGSVNIMYQ